MRSIELRIIYEHVNYNNLLGLAWDSKARKAVVERWQGFGLKMEILIWFSLKCIYNAVWSIGNIRISPNSQNCFKCWKHPITAPCKNWNVVLKLGTGKWFTNSWETLTNRICSWGRGLSLPICHWAVSHCFSFNKQKWPRFSKYNIYSTLESDRCLLALIHGILIIVLENE